MNRLTLLSSFLTIVIAHYMALTFIYEKKAPVIIKSPYQKVSVQLAQLKKPEPIKEIEKIKEVIKKPIEKPIEKPIITKKQVFKKPIKKKAKRKLVKKKIKKITKKKVVKKKPIKKIVKKPIEKKVEKLVEKAPTPIAKPIVKEKKVAKKTLAKSLERFKKFKANYINALRTAIDRNKKYPIASKRLREQGLAIVSFRVLKSGIFQNIRLITSSGKKRLDKAALKALIKTASFKPFTKEIKKDYMDLKLPIRFKIN